MELFAQEIAALEATKERQAKYMQATQSKEWSDFLLTFPNIRKNVRLNDYCNFAVGGLAKLFLEITSEAELVHLFCYLQAHKLELPLAVIGQGCNLLVADAGVSALVLYLGPKFSRVALQADYNTWDYPYIEEALRQKRQAQADFSETDLANYCLVHAQAGQTLKELVRQLAAKSYTGLEFACGIPGTLGGTTYMNAGAYGGSVSDCIVGVRYLAKTGDIVEIRPSYMELAYRSSYFMRKEMQGAVILGVSYLLKRGDKADIDAKIAELTEKRCTMQPLDLPSAGSIFKRPVPFYAGKLISDANLKGYKIGGAEVSTIHAGFIVNISRKCTAKDVCKVIQHVQSVIKAQNDVLLETEVRYFGDFTAADFADCEVEHV